MKFYAYKMGHDYGFAPNPFHGTLTLANCKPKIRLGASVGDWVIGTGSKHMGLYDHLIHLMQVSEKLTFQQYWEDPRFEIKKPVYNGSLVRLYGDNIYYPVPGEAYGQLKSFHSHHDGRLHEDHLKRDTKGKYVLISNHFWYFGNKNFLVPAQYINACSDVRDTKLIQDQELAAEFIAWVQTHFKPGLNGIPVNWAEHRQLKLFI